MSQTKCAYCDAMVDVDDINEPPPPYWDDEAWELAENQHHKGCEWVYTRAHTINMEGRRI